MAQAPVVAVRGEAVREVPPEIARFSMTVSVRHTDQRTALTRLAARSDGVRELIETYGSAIERRETGDLRVWPEVKGARERITAYHGSVTTTVTVTDFTVLGELMLRLAEQEQTSVAGPWWALRPGSPVPGEARRAAIADAVQRAREYAEALGARVTALVELADLGMAHQPMTMMRAGYAAEGAEAAGGLPRLDLDPQPQTVHAGVEARFTISEPTL